MNVTKEMKAKAAEIAKKQNVKTLWVNKNGEFFTSENMASLSVDGKKSDYEKINTIKAAEAGSGDSTNTQKE